MCCLYTSRYGAIQQSMVDLSGTVSPRSCQLSAALQLGVGELITLFPLHGGGLNDLILSGLLQATAAPVSSWVHWSSHVEKMMFCSRPFNLWLSWTLYPLFCSGPGALERGCDIDAPFVAENSVVTPSLHFGQFWVAEVATTHPAQSSSSDGGWELHWSTGRQIQIQRAVWYHAHLAK